MPRPTRSIPVLDSDDVARFWMKIDRHGNNDCWDWLACKDDGGYGKFSIQTYGKPLLYVATRIMYLLVFGIDPGSQLVCHSCDTPGCMNPRHLWLGTVVDNNHDRTAKGRGARGIKNRHARLMADDVRRIRESHETCESLAVQYGVKFAAISKIRTHRTWKHILRLDL